MLFSFLSLLLISSALLVIYILNTGNKIKVFIPLALFFAFLPLRLYPLLFGENIQWGSIESFGVSIFVLYIIAFIFLPFYQNTKIFQLLFSICLLLEEGFWETWEENKKAYAIIFFLMGDFAYHHTNIFAGICILFSFYSTTKRQVFNENLSVLENERISLLDFDWASVVTLMSLQSLKDFNRPVKDRLGLKIRFPNVAVRHFGYPFTKWDVIRPVFAYIVSAGGFGWMVNTLRDTRKEKVLSYGPSDSYIQRYNDKMVLARKLEKEAAILEAKGKFLGFKWPLDSATKTEIKSLKNSAALERTEAFIAKAVYDSCAAQPETIYWFKSPVELTSSMVDDKKNLLKLNKIVAQLPDLEASTAVAIYVKLHKPYHRFLAEFSIYDSDNVPFHGEALDRQMRDVGITNLPKKLFSPSVLSDGLFSYFFNF